MIVKSEIYAARCCKLGIFSVAKNFGATDASQPEAEYSGIAALVIIFRFLEITTDPAQLRHDLGTGNPATSDDLVRLAKRRDVRAKQMTVDFAALAHLPLPAVAATHDGSFVVVAQASDDAVLVQHAVTGVTMSLDFAAWTDLSSGTIILMTTRAKVRGKVRAFDVSWFVPALMR